MIKDAEKLLNMQCRCQECGKGDSLEIHHRIFRSEGNVGLSNFLSMALAQYNKTHKNKINEKREINDIQNLVVLCSNCHLEELHRKGLLREKYRYTFTCPVTWFSIEYFYRRTLY